MGDTYEYLQALKKNSRVHEMESFNPDKYALETNPKKEHAMLWGANDFKTIVKNNYIKETRRDDKH